MTTNKGARSNKKKSLCEKSMNIMVNIIKVSSLSLAGMSLRKTAAPTTRLSSGHVPVIVTNSITTTTRGSMASVARDNPAERVMSSKKPENNSNLPSYLVNPNVRKGSSYVIQEGRNVDSEASNFIQRFHEKNRKLSKISSKNSSSCIILPPPPSPILLKKKYSS